MLEIIITAAIVSAAGYILYKNVKKKSSGKFQCESCPEKCPMCKESKNK